MPATSPLQSPTQPRIIERVSEITFRQARRDEVPTLVEMLVKDSLGRAREDHLEISQAYFDAFEIIDADPNHELVVAELEGEIVATMQISYLQHLTYRGGVRAQIEGVRVSENHRGAGLGRRLMEWGIERAKQRGCHLVQLTSDKRRTDALRFYEQLGFRATHQGFKLHFDS